jgi:hypothetical protein
MPAAAKIVPRKLVLVIRKLFRKRFDLQNLHLDEGCRSDSETNEQ